MQPPAGQSDGGAQPVHTPRAHTHAQAHTHTYIHTHNAHRHRHRHRHRQSMTSLLADIEAPCPVLRAAEEATRCPCRLQSPTCASRDTLRTADAVSHSEQAVRGQQAHVGHGGPGCLTLACSSPGMLFCLPTWFFKPGLNQWFEPARN